MLSVIMVLLIQDPIQCTKISPQKCAADETHPVFAHCKEKSNVQHNIFELDPMT